MSFLDNFSQGQIRDVLSECDGFASALRQLGVSATSSVNRIVLSQYAKDNQIDVSHFTQEATKRSPSNIFVEHSTASQSTLRRYYKRGNYSEHRCSICGLEPFWNGQELVLTLDHINGINDDHRLENLRWVCPNCDMQLPTHGSKRTKIRRTCEKCGKELSGKRKSNLCKDCYVATVMKNKDSDFHVNHRKRDYHKRDRSHYINGHNVCKTCGVQISDDATYCKECYKLAKRKAERPSAINLAKMIVESSFVKVGEHFGVNGNAIKKWCQAYGIPHHKKDLVNWYNEQIGVIKEDVVEKATYNSKKPVKQIDMTTGEVIAVFESIGAAGKALNRNNSYKISEVCKGIRKSAYGYFWQYAD